MMDFIPDQMPLLTSPCYIGGLDFLTKLLKDKN
jgi:hypothetical protein